MQNYVVLEGCIVKERDSLMQQLATCTYSDKITLDVQEARSKLEFAQKIRFARLGFVYCMTTAAESRRLSS